jgi:hypothetical protein
MRKVALNGYLAFFVLKSGQCLCLNDGVVHSQSQCISVRVWSVFKPHSLVTSEYYCLCLSWASFSFQDPKAEAFIY